MSICKLYELHSDSELNWRYGINMIEYFNYDKGTPIIEKLGKIRIYRGMCYIRLYSVVFISYVVL